MGALKQQTPPLWLSEIKIPTLPEHREMSEILSPCPMVLVMIVTCRRRPLPCTFPELGRNECVLTLGFS